jgi:hypothetical protein
MPDYPLKDLLRAAVLATQHLHGCDRADCPVRVVVFCSQGRKVIDLAIPAEILKAAAEPEVPVLPPGWSFADKIALYDGRAVAVAPSRVKLLRVLVEAVGKLSAKELARLAFDREADEENARYHVKALRAELAAAFPGFEGEIVPGEGGYRLVLR